MVFFYPALLIVNLALAVAGLPATETPRPQKAEVITHCTVPNTVALTFDDGPYLYVYEITKQLAAANASATFFFDGDNYECIYEQDNIARIKHIFKEGHQIASHTWSHKDLTTLSRSAGKHTFHAILINASLSTLSLVNNEMKRIDLALQRIIGVVPAFFRPPYGNYNNLVREVAGSRGQDAILWDFDSGDSVGVSIGSQKYRYTELAERRPVSVLTLNHEVYASTVHDVLPHAIKKLQHAGYRLVTVAECLGRPPYRSIEPPARRDAWTC